jgi:predicted DNA-binding protein (UPF0251 family)/predicted Fe-Mo cluster-binding NifX family protein
MSRPQKHRRVAFIPDVTFFKPAGIPLRDIEEIQLTVEELEAIRLKDLEGLEQGEGADKMNVSRPTFQRILSSARQKIAEALLNGKSIRIEGGNFEFPPVAAPDLAAEDGKVKIAVISEDGTTISQHFRMAPYYVVMTVEDGRVVGEEKRDKTGPHTAAPPRPDKAPGKRYVHDVGALTMHDDVINIIADCRVLIAGGMGWGAYGNLKARGIETVITDVKLVGEAVKLYLKGKLPSIVERVH